MCVPDHAALAAVVQLLWKPDLTVLTFSPLVADASKNTFNMVVEIPRWTNGKLEISKYVAFRQNVRVARQG